MEQKPSRGPRKGGPNSTRQHSYHAQAGQDSADAARAAMQRRAQRKKQVRRNRIIGLLILLVLLLLLILGIVGVVRFLLRDTDEPASQVSVASVSALPEKDAQSGVQAEVVPEPEENPDDYTYYMEGIPVLLNKYNPLPDELTGELDVVEVGKRPDTGEMHSLVPEAAEAFLAMVEAAEEDGIKLYPVSGYRSHTRQVGNYNARVSEYVAQGYSQQEAEALTGQLIAVPGTSEHEAGLAIDINSLDQSFENTEAYNWLVEHCNDYGFILRYEKTTFAETGIDFEPWHYRYVGQNHAYAISELGLTLEAYVAYLGGEVKTATGTMAAPQVSTAASPAGASAASTASGGASSSSGASSAASDASDDEIPMG